MVDDPAYKAVEDKISAFVPEGSIVGMLMEHEEDYKVVDSLEIGLLQHEGFSWVIDRDSFVLVDDVDAFSKNLSVTLKTWLAEMTTQERKALVDSFFDVFVAAGIEDFTDIADIDVKMAGNLLKAVAKVPHENRERIGKLIKLLIEEKTKK